MNTITVADIMNLDIMKGCRLAAGEKGLSRAVHYINVYDNPLSETDQEIQTFPGEISLTFFYYGKNDPGYLYYTLELLIERRAAALIVFDEYFKEMPEDFTNRCNEAALPLIFVDRKVPYSMLISSIIECRIRAEQRKNIEDKINAIVSARTSPEEKMQLTSDLSAGFQNNIVVLFAMEPDSGYNKERHVHNTEILNLCSAISRDSRFFAAEYNSGVLVILSYSDNRLSDMHASIKHTVSLIHRYLPDTAVGISNLCHLPKLDTAITQSCTALRTGSVEPGTISAYRDLGITRVLFELLNTSALENFYHDIMLPIRKYDEENNNQLLETMLCFSSYDMDYKKTAEAMFVHENTIRYRIRKLKDLIPYGKSDMDFYETLSVTAKLYHMKQR